MQRYASIWFILFFLQGQAQSMLTLTPLLRTDATAQSITLPKPVNIPYDSVLIHSQLLKFVMHLNRQGFLNAGIADIWNSRDTLYCLLDPGEKYSWLSLRMGNVSEDWVRQSGLSVKTFKGKPFEADAYFNFADRLITHLEDHGYPFASLTLDSIEFEGGQISASLNLQAGIPVVFDTVFLRGNAHVQSWYLAKFLGIRAGLPYREKSIRNASSYLNQLPFISVAQPVSVFFYGNKAMPVLTCNKRTANQIDGILGFAPNNQLNNNSLLITGEANIRLQNLFESGKAFELHYRSFMGNSQDLRIYAMAPYLLRSNAGFDYHLSILKQDTSFLDVRNEFGVLYHLTGANQLRFFYQRQSSTLIRVDTLKIKNEAILPDAHDLLNQQYGLSFRFSRIDNPLNPRRGFEVDLSGSAGNKTIIRNPVIEALQFYDVNGRPHSIYEQTPLQLLQFRFKGGIDGYIPVKIRQVIRLQGMAAHVDAGRLFTPELFRIGGIRTLKGFNEQSIFASTYMILNTEWRYLFQRNSYVALFWNGATYSNANVSDTPFGFGAGLNFETNAGLFHLYYALGREFNNPIEWSRAKVHFGYVNYF